MFIRFINSFLTAADTPQGNPPFHVRKNRDEMIGLTHAFQGKKDNLGPGETLPHQNENYLQAMALAEAFFIDDVEATHYEKRGHFPAIEVATDHAQMRRHPALRR